jgi:uncharacterized membrane protein SpoIIM required for sporulation
MLEMLINPKKAERHPWEMLFIGMLYASLSILLVEWIFSQDTVLSQYSGILVVTFTVMFSLPFMYFTLRYEEEKIKPSKGTFSLLREHKRAIYAFLWLFVGFVIAFAFWYAILPTNQSFKAQIETYCLINRPTNFDKCVNQYQTYDAPGTANASGAQRLFLIFANNIYVLVFTLIFSLIFGAGVIFVLAWNASVIAAAIGIFTQAQISQIPFGLFRYMLHGIPEIGSYFIVALAGGIVSTAVIKHEAGTEKFWQVLQDSLHLIILAVIVLFLAALTEVFITPIFF